MRIGTAIWLIGWMFVMGWIGHNELEKNPNYKIRWQDQVKLFVAWPIAIGFEYAESREKIK